jgi:hypothetical protein
MLVPMYTLCCHVCLESACVPIIGNVVPNGMSNELVLVAEVGAGVGTTQGVMVRIRPEEPEHDEDEGHPVHCS